MPTKREGGLNPDGEYRPDGQPSHKRKTRARSPDDETLHVTTTGYEPVQASQPSHKRARKDKTATREAAIHDETTQGMGDDAEEDLRSLEVTEHGLSNARKGIDESTRALRSLKQKLKRYHKMLIQQENIKEVNNKLRVAKSQNRELENKIASLEKRKTSGELRLQREIDVLEAHLKDSETTSTSSYFQAFDNSITTRWQQLDGAIRQVVQDLSEDRMSGLVKLCRDKIAVADELLEHNPYVCNALIETLIWRHLDAHIFQQTSLHWAGATASALHHAIPEVVGMLDGEPALLSTLQRWCAETALMAENVTQTPKQREEAIKSVRDELLKEFSVHCPLDRTGVGLEDDLGDIIRTATDLDMMLRKSRAKFTVDFGRYEIKDETMFFEESQMEQEYNLRKALHGDLDDPPGAVDVVLKPALLKRGTSSGEHYDTTKVLRKMQVICDVIDWDKRALIMKGDMQVAQSGSAQAFVKPSSKDPQTARQAIDVQARGPVYDGLPAQPPVPAIKTEAANQGFEYKSRNGEQARTEVQVTQPSNSLESVAASSISYGKEETKTEVENIIPDPAPEAADDISQVKKEETKSQPQETPCQAGSEGLQSPDYSAVTEGNTPVKSAARSGQVHENTGDDQGEPLSAQCVSNTAGAGGAEGAEAQLATAIRKSPGTTSSVTEDGPKD